jgi:hypothetical protein
VLILNGVKVVCFVTLLEVLISNDLANGRLHDLNLVTARLMNALR